MKDNDYVPYSEYKRRQKKRRLNIRGWLLLAMIFVCVSCSTYYLLGRFFDDDKTVTAAADGAVVVNSVDAKEGGSKEAVKPTKEGNVAEEQGKVAEANATATKATNEAMINRAALFGDAKYLLHVHKLSYKLEVFEKGKEEAIKSYEVAVAKNAGDKVKSGDNTTPTTWGDVLDVYKKYPGAKKKVASAQVPFRVEEICDSSSWTHDFGQGEVKGAYGPWFISLDTGWDGIGIHGTHDPKSIGHKVSEGCIRMHNAEVEELKNLLYADKKGIGTGVVITED